MTENKKKKTTLFWSVVFSYFTQQWTISCPIMDFIWKSVIITSVVGLRRSSKALCQTCIKLKVMVTVWWSAASLIHYSFWILVKPLHLRNILSKLMRCTKNCNSAAGIGQQKGPNSSPRQCLIARHTTNTSKVEWIRLWNFASSAVLPDVSLQASRQIFARKMLSTTSRRQKMVSKSLSNFKAWTFML